MKKQGILKSWNSLRGFGTVVISRHEAYFLHKTSVVEGPENPALGSTVYFDAAPALRNGKLPQAVNAVIVEPVAGGAL
jgi:cold shock CspA family protein